MGQSMRIVSKREVSADSVRFELDRSITGTGHEAYSSPPLSTSKRLCDVLAGQIFAAVDVRAIHMFSNFVSVTVGPSQSGTDLIEAAIEQIFIHYQPGVRPTPVYEGLVSESEVPGGTH